MHMHVKHTKIINTFGNWLITVREP